MTYGTSEPNGSVSTIIGLVPGAAFGAVRATQQAAFSVIGVGMRGTGAITGAIATSPPLRRPLAYVESRVRVLAVHGENQRQADAARANALFNRAEGVMATVMRHAVDILPIEAVLARVDVNALVGSVDLNALLARVDLDALLTRLDLPSLISDVLAEIELGDLIQESTSNIASDARDAMRMQANNADDLLARVVDRILRRRRPRDLVVPGLAPGLATGLATGSPA